MPEETELSAAQAQTSTVIKWMLAGVGAIAGAMGLFIWQAPARIAVIEVKVEGLKDDQVYIKNTMTNVTEKIDRVLMNQREMIGTR